MSAPRKPLTPNDPRHGTYNGYQVHLQQKVPACDACLTANREYHRQHRATHPARVIRERRLHKAQTRALWQLAERHHDEFQTLWVAEFRKIRDEEQTA